MRAPPRSEAHCFLCKSVKSRNRIPKHEVAYIYTEERIYLHHECRVCEDHLTTDLDHFTDEALQDIRKLSDIISYSLSKDEVEELLDLMLKCAETPRIDFSSFGFRNDKQYISMTGLSKQNFDTLLRMMRPYLKRLDYPGNSFIIKYLVHFRKKSFIYSH